MIGPPLGLCQGFQLSQLLQEVERDGEVVITRSRVLIACLVLWWLSDDPRHPREVLELVRKPEAEVFVSQDSLMPGCRIPPWAFLATTPLEWRP